MPAAGGEDASAVIPETPSAAADDHLFDTSSMAFSPQLSGRARHHRCADAGARRDRNVPESAVKCTLRATGLHMISEFRRRINIKTSR